MLNAAGVGRFQDRYISISPILRLTDETEKIIQMKLCVKGNKKGINKVQRENRDCRALQDQIDR